jgi:hypothetical protein
MSARFGQERRYPNPGMYPWMRPATVADFATMLSTCAADVTGSKDWNSFLRDHLPKSHSALIKVRQAPHQ